MTKQYIRDHVAVVAKVFGKKQPFPENVIDIITEKLFASPRLQTGSVASTEYQLGLGCRHYVEEVNKLIEEDGA